ncbi:MAG: GAF domain-containing sensor histidine kinase [Anaerolineae bacterium]|nr:GAF domain-containing sensor histidine kinase [Anaerolineae bacterium]
MLKLIMIFAIASGAFFSGLAIGGGAPEGVWLGGGLLLLSAVILGFLSRRAALARQAAKQQAQVEQAMQSVHERARVLAEITNALGASLDYEKALNVALDVGALGLRVGASSARLAGAVLLFGEDDKLHVVSSRGLPPRDQALVLAGEEGLIAETLQRAEPVFASSTEDDPELIYFVAMHSARSLMLIPLRVSYENYGILIFSSTQPNAFSPEQASLLTAISTQVAMAIQNAILYNNLRQERDRLIEVEEAARQKLASDLHDGPTQQVSLIAMRLDYCRQLIKNNRLNELLPELQQLEADAHETVKNLRHMLFTLRPLVLETQGIVPALEQLSRKMLETHKLPVHLSIEEGVAELIEPERQVPLFHIIQEAVGNARKYAQTPHIDIRFSRQGRYVLVEVQDYGKGFDVAAVNGNYESRSSLGMINMRERAQAIDAQLRLESALGKGTKVSLLVPIRTVPSTSHAKATAHSTSRKPNVAAVRSS